MKNNIKIVLTASELEVITNQSDHLAKLLRINKDYYIIRNTDGSFKHVEKKIINQNF